MRVVKEKKERPKLQVGQVVTLTPEEHTVEEITRAAGNGHYIYKLSNGNWYFYEEVIP